MSNNIQNNDNNHIKIFLRIKSKNKDEQNNENSNYLDISNNNKNICLHLSQDNKAIFSFDKIFNEKENQNKIFEIIGKPLCDNFIEGYNSTIIFYGKKVQEKLILYLVNQLIIFKMNFKEQKLIRGKFIVNI